MMLLEISDLNVKLSGLHILQDLSLSVAQGELVVVVGANGAGKSTLMRTIAGLNPVKSGEIAFMGKSCVGLSPYEITSLGIGTVLEGRQLFPELSARENLLTGAYLYRRDKKHVEDCLRRVYSLFPVLEKNEKRIAGTFSGGEQQMISLGRGLMSEPKLLMIDEMSLGLAPLIIENLFAIIKKLNETGMSILLIEQNARQALKIADRAYVLENGRVSLSGTGPELLGNERVQSAYLGL